MTRAPPSSGSRALFEAAVTLFDLDERGRMRGERPHLHVLRTPHDVACLCHADLPDEAAAAVEAIARWPRGRPREWSREYADYLRALLPAGAPQELRAGALFSFPASIAGGEAAVSITRGNAHLLGGGLEEWLPDVAEHRPMSAMVVDGRAVGLCASVAMSRAAHSAGVETLGAYRGRGLAAQAVAAWARSVRALGAAPLYATTFDNLASQNLARRLGLIPFAAEFSVKLRRG